MAIGAVLYFQGFYLGGEFLFLGFVLTAYGMTLWLRDVTTEATYEGAHTSQVQNGLVIGFVLFIVSEAFAFLSVFWAFFHSSLSPAVEIGGVWPPQGITALDPFAIPLLNTILLLSSGAFVTYGHHALIAGDRKGAVIGTIITIILATIFTGLQYFEYCEASFTMSDGVYGSVFYASTGLHGLILAPINIYVTHPINIKFLHNNNKSKSIFSINENKLYLNPINKKSFYLDKSFLEWLAGFTDAEGSFSIHLKNKSIANFIFQITLHIDDSAVLYLIKEKLGALRNSFYQR